VTGTVPAGWAPGGNWARIVDLGSAFLMSIAISLLMLGAGSSSPRHAFEGPYFKFGPGY
jgi:hypothetical protein